MRLWSWRKEDLPSVAHAPWIAATHRFTEVSVGFLVALALSAVWQDERRPFDPQAFPENKPNKV
jgi:hypothetical protein